MISYIYAGLCTLGFVGFLLLNYWLSDKHSELYFWFMFGLILSGLLVGVFIGFLELFN